MQHGCHRPASGVRRRSARRCAGPLGRGMSLPADLCVENRAWVACPAHGAHARIGPMVCCGRLNSTGTEWAAPAAISVAMPLFATRSPARGGFNHGRDQDARRFVRYGFGTTFRRLRNVRPYAPGEPNSHPEPRSSRLSDESSETGAASVPPARTRRRADRNSSADGSRRFARDKSATRQCCTRAGAPSPRSPTPRAETICRRLFPCLPIRP